MPSGPERSRSVLTELLRVAGVAQAAREAIQVDAVAAELGISPAAVEAELQQLAAFGLVLFGDDLDGVPLLLNAGRQYLERGGAVGYWDLRFLPGTIDDLHAREALRRAGTAIIDRFRVELLSGGGAPYAARELVPPAFAPAVDERLALDLFAAGVSLLARLAAGEPAGCVAEEIMAVAMINEARAWLEVREADGKLGALDAQAAVESLNGLFELFQDSDVLGMFEMREPADAALAGQDPVHQWLGVADQRVESWFRSFGWTVPTGHLTDASDADDQPPT